MKLRESDAALRAANPIDPLRLEAPGLAEAERRLRSTILAEDRGISRDDLVQAPPRRRRRPYGRYTLALGGGVALAVLFLVGLGGGGRTGQPTSAFGAELVRFASSSPLVLLEAPGWHVANVTESPTEGEMELLLGDAPLPEEVVTVSHGEAHGMLPAAERERRAQLNWYGPLPGTSEDTTEKRFRSFVEDRSYGTEVATTAPVLGSEARVFQYPGGKPGERDITALWVEDGLSLEFRSLVPDMATFEERLASLRKVEPDAWLSALPPKVVKSVEHDPTVAEMLKGIPLPPGFTAADVPNEGLVNDRYQVGAEVTGDVACAWFAQWAQARREGDPEAVRRAIGAMSSAERWPVFEEMSKSGAFPQVVEELAADMPKGTVWRPSMPKSAWRPLSEDVESALACSRRGFPVSGPDRPRPTGPPQAGR